MSKNGQRNTTVGGRSAAALEKTVCVLVMGLTAALTGCGMAGGGAASGTSTQAAPQAVHAGRVFGGNLPVTGASIKLYAAGTTGYGKGATLLNTAAVTTDSNGGFTITSSYSCTTGQLVYIVATGGNTGAGTNAQSAMMAVLGACPAAGGVGAFLGSVPYIWINEVTTVAAVYALQQFMAPPSSANALAPVIGAPSTTYGNNPNSVAGVTAKTYASGQIGLANAFRMAGILANVATGTTPNTNYAYATPQSTKMYTVANTLASCVNSTGGVYNDGSACGTLFLDATPTSSQSVNNTSAADTIQAAWYMAQNPSNNVTALYNLGSASAPFTGLAAVPADLTIAVNFAPTIFTGNFAVSSPLSLAIDAYGNAWVANTGGLTGSAAASVTEIGADGSAMTTPVTSVTASTTGGAYSYFSTVPTSNTYTISTPKVVALDLNGNAWATLFGNTGGTPTAGVVAEITTPSTASLTGGTGATTATSTAFYTAYEPWGLAIDQNNNIYTVTGATSSNSALTLVDERSVAEMSATGANFTDTLQNTAQGTAAGGVASSSTTSDLTAAAYATPGSQSLLAIDTNTTAGPFVWGLNYNSCKVSGVATASTAWGTVDLYAVSNIAGAPPSDSDIASGFTNSGATGGTSGACAASSAYVGSVTDGTFNSSGSYTTMDPSKSTSALLYSSVAGTANPYGIAIDKNNGAWITDVYTSSTGFDGLTYLAAPSSSTGLVSTAYTYVDGGATGTTVAAAGGGTTMSKAGTDIVDGNNNVWAVTQTRNDIVEAMLCTASTTPACTIPQILMLTPGAGGTAGVGFVPTNTGNMLSTPVAIAIDPSGNVWTASSSAAVGNTYTNQAGGVTPAGNALTVLVGAAGPVVTPLSVAVANGHLGQKP